MFNRDIDYDYLKEHGKCLGYLKPRFDSCNSFYKKARVYETNGVLQLVSYETVVAQLQIVGNFVWFDLYGWYSATTNRHIKEFFKQFGIDDIPKTKELKKIGETKPMLDKRHDDMYLGKDYLNYLELE